MPVGEGRSMCADGGDREHHSAQNGLHWICGEAGGDAWLASAGVEPPADAADQAELPPAGGDDERAAAIARAGVVSHAAGAEHHVDVDLAAVGGPAGLVADDRHADRSERVWRRAAGAECSPAGQVGVRLRFPQLTLAPGGEP